MNIAIMKTFNLIRKWGVLPGLLVMLILFNACKDDLPSAMDTSDKISRLDAIRLINAGPDGNVVLEGTIDQDRKEINFPRIDPATDFSNLRFEIEAAPGTRLEHDSYAVPFQEGQSSRAIVIKVVNEPRSTEYFATFRLNIPVFGAEFSKAQVYDYLGYPSFTGLNTRGTGFDGEHVLVIDRGAAGPHLLAVSDLKNNVINRIPLNITGVTGGTFAYNMGAQVNGHTYLVSLSGSAASPLKIYHWTDPSAAPQVIGDFNVGAIAGAGARHGDNVSFNLDENGNGYIYLISNDAAPAPILRLKVTDYTTISEPFVVVAPVAYGQWSSYLQIGNMDQYLLTSNTQPISVVNANGVSAYRLAPASVSAKGTDARIIHFNGERYLMQITVARTGTETTVLEVYDITRGESVVQAFEIFEAQEPEDREPVYSRHMSSITNGAPASQTGYHILKDADGNDESLMIFGGAADVGFTIIEFPKKTLDD